MKKKDKKEKPSAEKKEKKLEKSRALLVEPFSIQVSVTVLERLFILVQQHSDVLSTPAPDAQGYRYYIFISLLRIFRANVGRLLASDFHMDNATLEEEEYEFSYSALLSFLFEVLALALPTATTATSTTAAAAPTTTTTYQLPTHRQFLAHVHRESITFLQIVLDVCYPTHTARLELTQMLLQAGHNNAPTSTSPMANFPLNAITAVNHSKGLRQMLLGKNGLSEYTRSSSFAPKRLPSNEYVTNHLIELVGTIFQKYPENVHSHARTF